MPSARQSRGVCAVCAREVALRAGGTARTHLAVRKPLRAADSPCEGSGQSPRKHLDDPDLRLPVRRFRKKPVEIAAVQLVARINDAQLREVAEWCGGRAIALVGKDGSPGRGISIPTLEGEMIAPVGWWVIKGVEGEFYGCKPTVFDQTYEPA